MRVFIANFGRENYLWPFCLSRSVVATFEEEDMWPLRLAGDKAAYIARCIAAKKTAKGITPTTSVASRWFRLASIIQSTENDLWVHCDKNNDLWWTVSLPGKSEVSREPAFKPSPPDEQVYVIQKRANAWSNQNKRGNRLLWSSLHPKAWDFLSTEATLQQLSDDFAAYALALVEGTDLSPWHSQPAWRRKAEKAGRGAGTSFNAKERSIIEMAASVRQTVANANGQEIMRTVKRKELRFATTQELEKYIAALLDAQEGLCAITGLPLQYYGQHDDVQLLSSLDRVDADGHYEAGNLQIVCRFVNMWKGAQDDAEFRRLVRLIRSAGGFD